MPSIQILLATYNGAAFLQEQLDSLFGQTVQDFEVLVADDGSDDETMAILEAAVAQRPRQVRIVYRSPVNGAARNFMRLVGVAEAPYVMFCDQDDVWLAHKIESMLCAMRQAEARQPLMPVLVHTDMRVVDERLCTVHPSFMAYQHVDFRHIRDLESYLCQNCVTGCASMVNQALLQRVIRDDPNDMVMHDWWIALVAVACGVIVYIEEPTLMYRQHGANALGASPPRIGYFAKRLVDLVQGGTTRGHLRQWSCQARAFLRQHGSDCGLPQRQIAAVVASLYERGPVARRYLLLRHRLLRQGPLRNLATWLAA